MDRPKAKQKFQSNTEKSNGTKIKTKKVNKDGDTEEEEHGEGESDSGDSVLDKKKIAKKKAGKEQKTKDVDIGPSLPMALQETKKEMGKNSPDSDGVKINDTTAASSCEDKKDTSPSKKPVDKAVKIAKPEPV